MTLTRNSMVLISLCAGLLAALLTYRFLMREKERSAELRRPVPVVVATKPIAARTTISPEDVSEVQRPLSSVPANAVGSLEEVVGQVAMAPLAEDQAISRKAVAPRSASLGLAYAVPEGMRAVAVALDPIIGVAGFLKPGDHVDVLATFTVGDLKVTKTVLQDVTLLAIGSVVSQEEPRSTPAGAAAAPRTKEQPNATLAVSPLQAERLILAEADGKLRLALRPADDESWVTQGGGARSDLLVGIRPPRPAGAVPAPTVRPSAPVASAASSTPGVVRSAQTHAIDTIRGTERSTVLVTPR